MSEYLVSDSILNFMEKFQFLQISPYHIELLFYQHLMEMTKINNLLLSDDVKTTMYSVGAIGVMFAENNGKIFTRGTGIREYIQSPETIDCGNSGTTARLLTGLLSDKIFNSTRR